MARLFEGGEIEAESDEGGVENDDAEIADGQREQHFAKLLPDVRKLIGAVTAFVNQPRQHDDKKSPRRHP